MAITVPDNMSYGGKKPNFDRDQFATLAAMNSFASDFLDEGHISYCVETKKHYKWTGTKWEEFGNIESGTSGGGELTENSVDTQHIKNGAVTEDKLSNEVKNKLNQTGGGGTFSGSASDVVYDNVVSGLESSNVQQAVDELSTKKVDRDDKAPKLIAGFANNLVGRGEATDETIGFRASGGDTSIEDGTARIERLKGNTVVWNQTYPTGWATKNQDVTSVSTNGLITLNGTTSTTYFNIKNGVGYSDIPTNHTGLYVLKVIKDDNKYLQGKRIGLLNKGVSAAIDNNFASFFYTNKDTNAWSFGFILIAKGDVITDIQIRASIYDLTKMFGAGNEPTTLEEFNARKPLGIDEYAYNEGELISTNVDEIKSVGFNAWDEEWEVGSISGHNGTEQGGTKQIRSKGYIQVIPNATYEICCTSNKTQGFIVVGYDQNLNYIKYLRYSGNSGSFTTPSNAKYIRFCTYAVDYGNTYNHDICIHLVHTGYRNGEYEPYKEFRRSLPISEIKDIEGNQLFPNGLLSAGNVYDEITATKAIKRVVALQCNGSEGWRLQSVNTNNNGLANFRAILPWKVNINVALGNIFGNQQSLISDEKNEGFFIYDYSVIYIRIKSSTVNTVDAFKTWLSNNNLTFNLVLMEPIEVDLPEPLNLDYEVSDFGTEEVISDTPTTLLKADIIYQFNAVDRIRDNSRHTNEAATLLAAKADKNKQLKLSVKDNGNIVLSNDSGESKEFMPATPSGDPMHYAYIAAGAEWNDTNEVIIKKLYTAAYNTDAEETFTFEHQPKCWYLNGIGDITNDEMRRIYNIPHKLKYKGAYSGINSERTIFFDGNNTSDAVDFSAIFSGSNSLISLIYKTHVYPTATSRMFVCSRLKYFLPYTKSVLFVGYNGFLYTDFHVNSAIEEIRIWRLRKNGDFRYVSKLSKNSVRYMINMSDATTAITIKLHADAYAKLATDADVVADLEAKNAALQGTGGSISLVSA